MTFTFTFTLERRINLEKLETRDERIEQLLGELDFYKSQAEKVEGLIDENVKQANKIEQMEADLEEISRQIESGLVD